MDENIIKRKRNQDKRRLEEYTVHIVVFVCVERLKELIELNIQPAQDGGL